MAKGMVPPITIKPGQKVPDSGLYRDTKSRETSTLVKGKIAPPTPEPGGRWREYDRAHPKR
jgi:hypothetical protein